ncbi:GMC family oxidoreductase [Streptomyces fractus]|uniref:GMC family oxidoreductase n=1 Tax=Streptomyces fractus TaxID=641806 RepID=UPI003CE96D81
MRTFDYVVVGGGTAGCVVATRLSEEPDVSVLLLEAGGDERRPDVENPGAWSNLLGTEADWNYETVFQNGPGRVLPAARGRILGGSGSINCMTHLRGHAFDYEEWAAQGATGWDYNGVLPYHKRSEDVPDGDPRYRGVGGPLHPRRSGRPHPLAQAYVEGAVALGHNRVTDFNAADMVGAGVTDSLIWQGRRESTATAYLRPAMGRPNLTVISGATVRRLVIQEGRCTGLDYLGESGPETVSAGEVVLTSGAVGTPHLLMLSGVGPAADLAAVGIEVMHDAPQVGANLQDHIMLTGIRYRADKKLVSTGMDGSTLLARINPGAHGPDLHLSAMNFDYHMPWQQPAPNSMTFGIGHMRPRSRGSVRIVSSDPTVQPAIDPAYVADPWDVDQLIRGIETVDQIVSTGALGEWGGFSETAELLKLDRAALEAEVRDAVTSYFHLSSTCRMGTDEGAVVDPELRVRGINGLRVADASIQPTAVSCNTNAAAVMIGEKAADLIRGRSLRSDIELPAVGAAGIPA